MEETTEKQGNWGQERDTWRASDHTREAIGNVVMTCRYERVSRQDFRVWKWGQQADRPAGRGTAQTAVLCMRETQPASS
jgi:hypothetical protein